MNMLTYYNVALSQVIPYYDDIFNTPKRWCGCMRSGPLANELVRTPASVSSKWNLLTGLPIKEYLAYQ